jgi:hypothetical protein
VIQEIHQPVWHILVYGLKPEITPIRFTSGLSIHALDAPLTVFDLAACGAAGFREWAILEPFLENCNCEIVSPISKATEPGYDSLTRAWLLSSLLTLRGFGKHLCLACNSYSWNMIAGHQSRTKDVFFNQVIDEGVQAAVQSSERQLPLFKGNLLDYHLKLMVEKACRSGTLTKEDAHWVDQQFSVFNLLAAESEKFRFAFEAAIDWRYAKDARAAIARIWSGIEAIFGINTELVFRISLLASSLLTKRGPDRQLMFQRIKELYRERSKAVHGEEMNDDSLIQTVTDSYELLREILLRIVAIGRPITSKDFDEAISY